MKLIRLFTLILSLLVPFKEYAAFARIEELYSNNAQGIFLISDIHIPVKEQADQAWALIDSLVEMGPDQCTFIVEDMSDIDVDTHAQLYKNTEKTLITDTARQCDEGLSDRMLPILNPLYIARICELHGIKVNNIECRQLIGVLPTQYQLDLLEGLCEEIGSYNDNQISNEYYAYTIKQAREACAMVHNHPDKDTIYKLSYLDLKERGDYIHAALFNARIDLFNSRLLHAIVTTDKPFVVVLAGAYHTKEVGRLLAQMGYMGRHEIGGSFEHIHNEAGAQRCTPISVETIQTQIANFNNICAAAHDWQERLQTVNAELPVFESLIHTHAAPNALSITA